MFYVYLISIPSPTGHLGCVCGTTFSSISHTECSAKDNWFDEKSYREYHRDMPESRIFSWRRAKQLKQKNSGPVEADGRSVEDTCVRSHPHFQTDVAHALSKRNSTTQRESTRTSEESCVCFACPLGWCLLTQWPSNHSVASTQTCPSIQSSTD